MRDFVLYQADFAAISAWVYTLSAVAPSVCRRLLDSRDKQEKLRLFSFQHLIFMTLSF